MNHLIEEAMNKKESEKIEKTRLEQEAEERGDDLYDRYMRCSDDYSELQERNEQLEEEVEKLELINYFMRELLKEIL